MKVKKIIVSIIVVIVLAVILRFAYVMQNSEETFIFDSNAFSRITTNELLEKMGECSDKESWVNKTSKGSFNCTTYYYSVEGNHYEFIVCDDVVVRVSVYSPKWWTGEGEPFKYKWKNKMDILKMFGITASDDARAVVDNGFTWKISPVSDTVAEFNVQNIDSGKKTFDLVKITYDLRYFD